MIIIDAHEDLAYNVLSDGRNYLQSAYQTRAEEEGGPVLELNGLCTLGLPEWLEGSVAFVFSTLFTMPREAAKPGDWALDPDWRRGGDKKNVTLEAAVRTIDAVCQLAGDAHHVGIGTDFDGGFGAEAIPAELDTIGDLPRLAEALTQHGYSGVDIEAIMGGNWLRLLRQVLPVSNPQSPISNL